MRKISMFFTLVLCASLLLGCKSYILEEELRENAIKQTVVTFIEMFSGEDLSEISSLIHSKFINMSKDEYVQYLYERRNKYNKIEVKEILIQEIVLLSKKNSWVRGEMTVGLLPNNWSIPTIRNGVEFDFFLKQEEGVPKIYGYTNSFPL